MNARAAVAALAAVVCLLTAASPASGQQQPRYEVSAGALFAGGYPLSARDAELIRNQAGGSPFTVFTTDTRADAAPGFEARLGVRLSRTFLVEGGAFTSRRRLTARLTSDVEQAPDLTIREDVALYIIDASLVARFGAFARGRAVPFARVGGGYLRELHEDNALVETGRAYHAGGGLTWWLTAGRRPLALRVDGRVYVLEGGIDLGTGNRTLGAGGAAVVFTF